ncbi:MAG TPA: Dabb family protein [Blastocatellia bacterium]|nr:Dabb family protein [Blastocatellia bacterium]
MIKHVVFFKFKPDVDEQARESGLDQLRQLPRKIDFIRSFELGRDALRTPRSWDAVLIATYDDMDSLHRYAIHEAHVPAARHMQSLCESIGSVDYEL